MQAVAVYCGSRCGALPAYRQAAEQLGRRLAQRGCTLVYGGSGAGLMGTVAEAALGAGGRVIGVIPDILVERELAHRGLTELHVVRTMHERKARMAQLSDAFVALPGGLGTLEEIVETFTWTQLGLHDKPCALLDVEGYYGRLLAFLDHAVEQGFLRREQFERLLVCASADELMSRLAAIRPTAGAGAIERC